MRSKLILFALCAASVPGSALAQVTSSPLRRDALQEQAARAIPFDQLSEGSRTKLWQVVSQPSVFRRMPAKTIECDPDLYVFLARYPEVVVNIWQLMGVTTVDMKRTGDFAFWATDGSGTTSSVELIYGTREMHVFYAEGVYEGPLFRNKIDGQQRCRIGQVLRQSIRSGPDKRRQPAPVGQPIGTRRTGSPRRIHPVDVGHLQPLQPASDLDGRQSPRHRVHSSGSATRPRPGQFRRRDLANATAPVAKICSSGFRRSRAWRFRPG